MPQKLAMRHASKDAGALHAARNASKATAQLTKNVKGRSLISTGPQRSIDTKRRPEPAFESVCMQRNQVPRVRPRASATIRPNRTPVARGISSCAFSCPQWTEGVHREPRLPPVPAIRRSTMCRTTLLSDARVGHRPWHMVRRRLVQEPRNDHPTRR